MAVAVAGMVIYSWAVEADKQNLAKGTPTGKNSLTEEEFRLLKESVDTSTVKDTQLPESKV